MAWQQNEEIGRWMARNLQQFREHRRCTRVHTKREIHCLFRAKESNQINLQRKQIHRHTQTERCFWIVFSSQQESPGFALLQQTCEQTWTQHLCTRRVGRCWKCCGCGVTCWGPLRKNAMGQTYFTDITCQQRDSCLFPRKVLQLRNPTTTMLRACVKSPWWHLHQPECQKCWKLHWNSLQFLDHCPSTSANVAKNEVCFVSVFGSTRRLLEFYRSGHGHWNFRTNCAAQCTNLQFLVEVFQINQSVCRLRNRHHRCTQLTPRKKIWVMFVRPNKHDLQTFPPKSWFPPLGPSIVTQLYGPLLFNNTLTTGNPKLWTTAPAQSVASAMRIRDISPNAQPENFVGGAVNLTLPQDQPKLFQILTQTSSVLNLTEGTQNYSELMSFVTLMEGGQSCENIVFHK